MTDNEIKREQPSFEVRAESLKKRTKEFFSTYENPNGSEDRLEICLIREGYRAVLMAEEEINRQKANAEGLTNAVKYLSEELTSAKAEIERLTHKNVRLSDMLKASTKLINRQKAGIEALKTENKQLQSDVITTKQNYEHIKELLEIEKATVKRANERFFKAKKGLEETQEKLEALLCEVTGGKLSKHSYTAEVMTTQAHEHLLKCCEDERAEAVKEFAEKVKAKIFVAKFKSGKSDFSVTTIDPSEIDNLVKEMVGEG